jgi:hypothetical protein
MELYLWVAIDLDKTFEIHRQLYNSNQGLEDSVLKLDYKFLPWPRYNGNLLWQ